MGTVLPFWVERPSVMALTPGRLSNFPSPLSLLLFSVSIRPLFAVFAFYDRTEKPTLSIWFPLQLCLYSITLDFFFYVYHRSMHEIGPLWRFHQRLVFLLVGVSLTVQPHLISYPNPFPNPSNSSTIPLQSSHYKAP